MIYGQWQYVVMSCLSSTIGYGILINSSHAETREQACLTPLLKTNSVNDRFVVIGAKFVDWTVISLYWHINSPSERIAVLIYRITPNNSPGELFFRGGRKGGGGGYSRGGLWGGGGGIVWGGFFCEIV